MALHWWRFASGGQWCGVQVHSRRGSSRAARRRARRPSPARGRHRAAPAGTTKPAPGRTSQAAGQPTRQAASQRRHNRVTSAPKAHVQTMSFRPRPNINKSCNSFGHGSCSYRGRIPKWFFCRPMSKWIARLIYIWTWGKGHGLDMDWTWSVSPTPGVGLAGRAVLLPGSPACRLAGLTGGLPCRLAGCLALWLARWMARGPWRLA